MKEKFIYFLFIAAVTILAACNNEFEHETREISEAPTETISFSEDEMRVLMQMRNPDNHICIDEAIGIALDALDFFSISATTRSATARTIASVAAVRSEPSTKTTTRSTGESVEVNLPDTVAYVFNFGDNAGFAIVAADTRIESSILAFVEDGYLDLSEEIDHPGLAIFLAGTEEYIERSIIEAELRKDSLKADILAKIQGGVNTRFSGQIPEMSFENTEVVVVPGPWGPWTGVRPLLPVEWGQDFPFNEIVRARNCPAGTAPAGCVATALAQIMAFWRQPTQIDGFTFDWNLLNQYTARPNHYNNVLNKRWTPIRMAEVTTQADMMFVQGASRLMERIGHHVGMTYRCSADGGSVATTTKAFNYLKTIGYSLEKSSYNLQTIQSSLNNNRPVFASGFAGRSTTWLLPTRYFDGHAWVIDGHIRRSRQADVTVTTFVDFGFNQPRQIISIHRYTETQHSQTYLHNNWGWDGSRNGFFVAGVFNTAHRVHHSSGDWTESSTGGTTSNFQYNTEFFTNIRR